MRKIYSLIVVAFASATMFAAVGPQSIQVTFNGSDSEGWVASSGGSVTSVADGVANVQMAVQSSGKYRADFQYNTADDFSFDKAKDIVWAIKLTSALPGAANSRKFEINYTNAESASAWINGISGPSGSLDCADGGKIYYFDLAALNKLGDVQEGEVAIRQIHFIMADATELTDETAKYAVDWVASFETVNDLKTFADWNDEREVGANPLCELLFRPKADGSGYDKRGNAFRAADVEFEGNYQARLFAVEYFLVKNFDAAKNYELVLTATGSNTSDLSVWDFPYQVNYEETPADIIAKATAVVGVAPGASEGDLKAPVASAKIADGAWAFEVPAAKLTKLATKGDYTLVGLFVTSKQATTNIQKGKYASMANTTYAAPSFKVVEDEPTAIDEITNSPKGDQSPMTNKILRNGQVLILRDGVEFNILGQIVK